MTLTFRQKCYSRRKLFLYLARYSSCHYINLNNYPVSPGLTVVGSDRVQKPCNKSVFSYKKRFFVLLHLRKRTFLKDKFLLPQSSKRVKNNFTGPRFKVGAKERAQMGAALQMHLGWKRNMFFLFFFYIKTYTPGPENSHGLLKRDHFFKGNFRNSINFQGICKFSGDYIYIYI